MKKIKTYSELSELKTFIERFQYLQIGGRVGVETFGADRYLNQRFYKSGAWLHARDQAIFRDDGCDLGMPDRKITGHIYVHHMFTVTKELILKLDPRLINPEYLICSSYNTHQAIHYGDDSLLIMMPQERTKNDTCPWKKQRKA